MAIFILHDEEPADRIHDCSLWHNKPWPQWLMMEMSRTGFFSKIERSMDIYSTDKNLILSLYFKDPTTTCILRNYKTFILYTDSVTRLQYMTIYKPRLGFHCRESDQRIRRGRW